MMIQVETQETSLYLVHQVEKLPMQAAPEIPEKPPSTSSAASRIAAHLDVGTIVTGVIGFLLVMLVNRGIENLDSLTTEVGKLNLQVGVILEKGRIQERKDERQDERIDRHHERLQHLEEAVSVLRERSNRK